MKTFLGDDFLLSSDTAVRLYHDIAAQQPIFDYHCHLDAKQLAANQPFENLTDIWLKGDHYKWRAMRAAGVAESLITGQESSDRQKYDAWAQTVPKTLGNPLYHWTHLELRRPFGITGKLFSPSTAEEIWQQTCQQLQEPAFTPRGILQHMQVAMVGTTDDPCDDLHGHQQLSSDPSFTPRICPSFRPDKAFKPELPGFCDYIARLSAVTDISIERFVDLQQALRQRLDHFDRHDCVTADHGIEVLRYAPIPGDQVLDRILVKRLQHLELSELEIAQFTTAMLVWLADEYRQRGWVMQFHIGALRNTRQRMLTQLGPDSGFDSMDDRPYAAPLAALLDTMDKDDNLPKTILYCLNTRDYEMLATMAGNFQSGEVAGKVQFGSGWWYNDQKDGITRQLEQLSQLGLLSQFVGMITDSRSFLSYTRHEYFRRLLCEFIGSRVEAGEFPNDAELIDPLVANLCFHNAQHYFKFPR